MNNSDKYISLEMFLWFVGFLGGSWKLAELASATGKEWYVLMSVITGIASLCMLVAYMVRRFG